MSFAESMPTLILGAGGHARVLIDAVGALGGQILGILDPSADLGREICGVRVLGDDDAVAKYDPTEVILVNGVGVMPGEGARRVRVHERMTARGYRFATVVHPAATVSEFARLAAGVQVMAGAVIQPGVRVGTASIVNTGTTIDHDCEIGSHVHLAPGVTISGDVRIGDHAFVGTGASVIQGVQLEAGCVVGAGATVLRDVAPDERYLGFGERLDG